MKETNKLYYVKIIQSLFKFLNNIYGLKIFIYLFNLISESYKKIILNLIFIEFIILFI